MLGAIALVGLKPWATSTVSPSLSVSPGLDLALGQAQAVVKAPPAEVEDRQVGNGGTTATVAVKATDTSPGGPEIQPSVGVSPGQPLPDVETTPSPSPPPATQPAPAPPAAAAEPPPPGPSAPVVAGSEEGAQAPPVAAGAEEEEDDPEPTCEGDRYEVTIAYEVDEPSGERVPTEILVVKIEEGESVSEFRVKGDLSGYRDLIAALGADGSCVEVEFVPVGAEEAPVVPAEAAEPGEAPEPAAP